MTAPTPDKDAAMTQEKLTDGDYEMIGEEWLKHQRLSRAHLASFMAGVRAASGRHRAAAEPKEDMVLIEETTDAIPLNEDWVTRACMEMGSPDVSSDMKLTRSVIAAYLRCQRDSASKEDMLDKASTWLAAYHAYTTGNRQYAVEALAMEFESISTEATRKERERAAGIAEKKAGCPVCEDTGEIPDTYQPCKGCALIYPIEAMTSSEDGCWFCPLCVAKWNATDFPSAGRDEWREAIEKCVEYHIHGQRSCQGQANAASTDEERIRYLDRARMHQRYALAIRRMA